MSATPTLLEQLRFLSDSERAFSNKAHPTEDVYVAYERACSLADFCDIFAHVEAVTKERDELRAIIEASHNGYDPNCVGMFPEGPPASHAIALRELLTEKVAINGYELKASMKGTKRIPPKQRLSSCVNWQDCKPPRKQKR